MMATIKRYKYSRVIWLTVSSFILLVTCLASPVTAKPGYPWKPGPGPGLRLGFGPGPGPGFYSVIHVGAMPYYFMDGLFYRPGPKGYIVVQAPLGAVITTLPPAAYMVTIDGAPYYSCSGVFYKQVPDGYVVISQPVKQVNPEVGIGQELLVQVNLLNIRSGPGLKFEPVGQLKKHQIVRVEALSSNWALIRFGNNTTGWIKTEYTSAIESGAKG